MKDGIRFKSISIPGSDNDRWDFKTNWNVNKARMVWSANVDSFLFLRWKYVCFQVSCPAHCLLWDLLRSRSQVWGTEARHSSDFYLFKSKSLKQLQALSFVVTWLRSGSENAWKLEAFHQVKCFFWGGNVNPKKRPVLKWIPDFKKI